MHLVIWLFCNQEEGNLLLNPPIYAASCAKRSFLHLSCLQKNSNDTKFVLRHQHQRPVSAPRSDSSIARPVTGQTHAVHSEMDGQAEINAQSH